MYTGVYSHMIFAEIYYESQSLKCLERRILRVWVKGISDGFTFGGRLILRGSGDLIFDG